MTQNLEKDVRRLRFFDSFNMQYDRFYPLTKQYNDAGIPNFGAFGLEGDCATLFKENWQMRQRVGANVGFREKEDLFENIEFEGDYLGGYSASSSRWGLYLGPVFAYQPTPKLEIGIPVNFVIRHATDRGHFYLYEGQTIDPADEVSSYEANSANSSLIKRSTMAGFKTGLELIAFPNSHYSFVGRFNFQYFGKRDVYNISDGRFVPAEGVVTYEATPVDNSSDIGFTIGVRFYFYTVSDVKHRKSKQQRKPHVILDPKDRQPTK